MELKNITFRDLIKLIVFIFRALSGAFSLMVSFTYALFFICEWRIELFLYAIGFAFVFIIISGNIKRPLYLLILPVLILSFMAIPLELAKTGADFLFVLFCGVLTTGLITRHYNKKERDQGRRKKIEEANNLPDS